MLSRGISKTPPGRPSRGVLRDPPGTFPPFPRAASFRGECVLFPVGRASFRVRLHLQEIIVRRGIFAAY